MLDYKEKDLSNEINLSKENSKLYSKADQKITTIKPISATLI